MSEKHDSNYEWSHKKAGIRITCELLTMLENLDVEKGDDLVDYNQVKTFVDNMWVRGHTHRLSTHAPIPQRPFPHWLVLHLRKLWSTVGHRGIHQGKL